MKITGQTGGRNLRALAGTRQDWQRDAWAYRDMIGEVRFGTEFLGHTVGSAGWLVQQVNSADVAFDGLDVHALPAPADP